jgi:hypothetical protein
MRSMKSIVINDLNLGSFCRESGSSAVHLNEEGVIAAKSSPHQEPKALVLRRSTAGHPRTFGRERMHMASGDAALPALVDKANLFSRTTSPKAADGILAASFKLDKYEAG